MPEKSQKEYLKENNISLQYLEAKLKFINLRKIRLDFMNGFLINMIWQF